MIACAAFGGSDYMIISPGAPRYTAAVKHLESYIEDLKIERPTNSDDIRAVLNGLISEALRLRVNIEYEMNVRDTKTRALDEYE